MYFSFWNFSEIQAESDKILLSAKFSKVLLFIKHMNSQFSIKKCRILCSVFNIVVMVLQKCFKIKLMANLYPHFEIFFSVLTYFVMLCYFLWTFFKKPIQRFGNQHIILGLFWYPISFFGHKKFRGLNTIIPNFECKCSKTEHFQKFS